MKLIIAEKKSVGETIAKVLGAKTKKNGYIEGKALEIAKMCGGKTAAVTDVIKIDLQYK